MWSMVSLTTPFLGPGSSLSQRWERPAAPGRGALPCCPVLLWVRRVLVSVCIWCWGQEKGFWGLRAGRWVEGHACVFGDCARLLHVLFCSGLKHEGLVLKFSVDINSFCFDISAIAFCMFPPQSSLILVLLGVGFMLESSYFTLFTLSKTLSLWLVEQAAFSPGILILGSSYLISVGFCNLHHLSCWAVTERTAKWRRSERRPLLSRLHYTILLL